jgi:WD40 repeat protein
VVSGSEDGTVRIWDVRSGAWTTWLRLEFPALVVNIKGPLK